jgi:hypothetical protein
MVSLRTNDPKHPVLTLTLSGKVEKFMEMRPAQARLEGLAGVPLSVEIEILQNKEYPFKILGIETKRTDSIRAEVVAPCDSVTQRCILRVENLRTAKGRYAETITVRTDNGAKPSFPIPVVGIIN